ncbi:MAG: immunoglobulin domain-containing protein [Cephaloticoccus sp.]|nr:immunoglobulin domain-containing protein [Cephaloticoccus sp.]MCF7760510.1 immunoglobulin domain-containing protein [Cephaloticoccus sp.]
MSIPRLPLVLFLFSLAGFLTRAIATEVISNGSFETVPPAGSVPPGWTLQTNGPTPPTLLVTGAQVKTGTVALRVDGRVDAEDGVKQNITPLLQSAANGSGRRYALRCWIRLDDFASVRVVLHYGDDAGQHPDLVLAERTVLTAGQWVLVEGTRTITWQGTLQLATIQFQVSQLANIAGTQPTRLFPGYYLDEVAMDLDTDGDGLMDRDEPALGMNPNSADSDGDSLPDWWERDHGFSASVNESALDTDGDGFTNRQEYFAATDPRDASSYPGKPANPNANAATRAVLRWLALLPAQAPNGHLAVGQMVSDLTTDPTEYPRMIDGLATLTGHYPAIASMAIEHATNPGLQIAECEARALAYWQAGGLVLLKWAIHNPWTLASAGDTTSIDITGLLNPASSAPSALARNQAANAVLQGWMTEVGDALTRLQAQGVVVMFRPISEMNGPWFWWGHWERSEYLALWQHLYNYFTVTRGLNNLIWVAETDSGTHAPGAVGGKGNPSDYYYPGDNYTDVFGHNLYDVDWVLDFDSDRVYARFPKVFGVPQAGPDHGTRTGTFDNLIYLQRSEAALPRSSFFVVWNSFQTDHPPAPAVPGVQKIGIVDNVNASALMSATGIVNRELLPPELFGASAPPPPVTPGVALPTITNQPASVTATIGANVNFTVAADGNPTGYQWTVGGATIAGATSASLTLTAVQTNQAGNYAVTVSNAGGAVVSRVATLTVLPGGTTSQVVTTGHDLVFSATNVSGAIQWQESTDGGTSWHNLANNGNYQGATTTTLQINGASGPLNGAQFRYVTSTVTSAPFVLTVMAALLPFPVAVSVDGTGNIFVADASLDTIQKIAVDLSVTEFAGLAGQTGTADGAGTTARFNEPSGIVVGADGILSVTDSANATIRVITPAGVVSTLAGSTVSRGNADGTGSAATFSAPLGIARDTAGNLYVADAMNHTVRKITTTGTVSTLAGRSGVAGSSDGPGAAARFNHPTGVAVDGGGNVYVADAINNLIRRINPAGVVTTLAGTTGVSGTIDGSGGVALFNNPGGLVSDVAGNLYIADTGNSTVRKIAPDGTVTTLAGLPGVAGLQDGTGFEAWFNQPRDVALDPAGNLVVADTGNAVVRRVTLGGVVTTPALIAGVSTPVTPTPTTPVVTTPPSSAGQTSAAASSGGGGGGAASPWFLTALSLLSLGRRYGRPLAVFLGL